MENCVIISECMILEMNERKNFFNKLGYIDIQYLAPRIRGEVLMLTGLLDNICPPETQFAAYNKMTCKKKYILYPNYQHEKLKDVDDITYQFLLNGKV